MTSERNADGAGAFVTAVLPRWIGAAGLLVYLLTLNHWISVYSAGTVARVSGWWGRPELSQPLTCALLFPFRWLPEARIPLILNLFNAVCAGLVLMLLARSVALLPQDVAPTGPLPEPPGSNPSTGMLPYGWLPPVLAAVVCGLQLTFWEQATSATGEMIDLLVFAFVIRCLLEFRIAQRQFWLSCAACFLGAGMANNWALIGFFPGFLLAVFRMKDGAFFDVRFLAHMALWGLAGLSLYLLLPALHSLSTQAHVDFWPALKANLQSQREMLSVWRRPAWRVLAFGALLPLLVLSIRWKSHTVQFADDTRLGVFLTKATVHFVHGLFFAVALWLALDPSFSPRHLGLGLSMLSHYYLSALVVGYCAGYFLLLGSGGLRPAVGAPGSKPVPWKVSEIPPPGILAKVAAATVGLLLAVMPLALAWRNFGQIRFTNGPALREFARQLYADLPTGKSVGLSDDPKQLFLLQAELAARGGGKEALLLGTPELASLGYQAFMAGKFKSRWPVTVPTNRLGVVGPMKLVDLFAAFVENDPVAYLHQSYGLVFERFDDQPSGFVHRLVPRTASKAAHKLPEYMAAANELVWQERWTNKLEALAARTKQTPHYQRSWARPLFVALRLADDDNVTSSFLGAAYSKSLNYWGVQEQRLGNWSQAGVWFDRAVELNPNNLSARINAQYNDAFLLGNKGRLDAAAVRRQFEDLFSQYANWADVLNANGPVDEPTFLCEAAWVLLASKNNRQAASEFARCVELAPDWPAPRLWLALSYLDDEDFAAALEVTDGLATLEQAQNPAQLSQILFCRTTALQRLQRTQEAAACLEHFVSQYTGRKEVLVDAADLFLQNLQFKKTLVVLTALLKEEPNEPALLAQKGWAELELGKYELAIASLTRTLSLSPGDDVALLRRAMASLGAGHFDAARSDCQKLRGMGRQAQNALFGLATIAWRQQDTNAAIELYQQYLAQGNADSPQYRQALQALERLKIK